MLEINYSKLMDRLLELPSCVLFTTGRTGTDLLQSLLDSHPEVLMFNGHLFYHDFWKTSLCVAAGKFELKDFIDEFIGRHIEKLKSRYDIRERKNRLGDEFNQSIDIDTARFKTEAARLLEGRQINSKNSMLAIYAAYAICLGHDIEKKKILFHHLHDVNRIRSYLEDFPDTKIICMTRDPRANFVSGIEHWREYFPPTDQGAHLYFYIKRILEDSTVFEKYGNEYTAIRIEDLGKECILRKLCEWLNISYDECLKKSTWAGMAWHGDGISQNKKTCEGFSEEMLRNNWEKKLSHIDRYILNYIMFYRLKHYSYRYRNITFLDTAAVPFLILLPLSYELRFFSFGYIWRSLQKEEYLKMVKNVLFYFKRVFLFIKHYLKAASGKIFKGPFLSC